MSDKFKPVASVSIARHAVQFILRSALAAGSVRCFGLIGRQNGLTINHATTLPVNGMAQSVEQMFESCDLQHTLAAWSEQAITPCGIFFATENGEIPAPDELKRVEAALAKRAPAFAAIPLIHMPLLLNTAGCLEAFAYQIRADSLVSIPLLLEEDGQQAKNG